ncbi:hypothetical protein [Streptomyces sp. NPDC057375]|uniref:hypothetical protein n=1 Tax=Streptomyces sp. NPDC057375 TaxID=3346109 RepID=UPI0036307F9F
MITVGGWGASLHGRLQELATRVAPRTQHGLIHGELGPDRVLVDDSGHPVLIDIEGLMFFDVEWEHVVLQLRFGDQHSALSRPGLDPARLDLYMLAMRLSLVAGPLRLLDGNFPYRTVMQEIAEHNAKEALVLLVSWHRGRHICIASAATPTSTVSRPDGRLAVPRCLTHSAVPSFLLDTCESADRQLTPEPVDKRCSWR